MGAVLTSVKRSIFGFPGLSLMKVSRFMTVMLITLLPIYQYPVFLSLSVSNSLPFMSIILGGMGKGGYTLYHQVFNFRR